MSSSKSKTSYLKKSQNLMHAAVDDIKNIYKNTKDGLIKTGEAINTNGIKPTVKVLKPVVENINKGVS